MSALSPVPSGRNRRSQKAAKEVATSALGGHQRGRLAVCTGLRLRLRHFSDLRFRRGADAVFGLVTFYAELPCAKPESASATSRAVDPPGSDRRPRAASLSSPGSAIGSAKQLRRKLRWRYTHSLCYVKEGICSHEQDALTHPRSEPLSHEQDAMSQDSIVMLVYRDEILA